MSEERYEIIKLLGKGRTGGVYEAEDTRLGRKVAMRRFFSQTDQIDVSEYEDDFINISQSLSALQHPNLLRVFDAGADEDGAFIISQMLKGDTLHNRLKEGPISNWDVWDLGHQMLDALSTAHAGGFVHGAITPGSILMSPRARGGFLYVILDMGLCRLSPLIQGKDSVLSMMADPAILAPELFDGSEANEKADLYMLGNILYMCLAGGHPFAGRSLEECSQLHKQGLPPLKGFAPDAPDDFVEWIAELCEISPHDRPHSVVTALQTMPKVDKPASVHSTSVHTVPAATPASIVAGGLTAPATPAAPANPAAPAANVLAAGPLTAGARPGLGAGPATTLGGVGAQSPLAGAKSDTKKSNKGLFITLGAIALVGIVLFLAMGGDKKTGEEIAAEKAKKKNAEAEAAPKPKPVASKVRNEKKVNPTPSRPVPKPAPKPAPEAKKTYPSEEIIAFNIAKGTPAAQGWKSQDSKQFRVTVNGFSIVDEKGLDPALSKRLKGSDIEDMYNKGWSLKYEVYARKGLHMLGFNIDADNNEYWLDKSKNITMLLHLQSDGESVILAHRDSDTQAQVVGGGKTFFTVELRGKPQDPTGKVELYINNKLMNKFNIVLNQKRSFSSFFTDSLFISSGGTTASGANWIVRKYNLSVGTD